MRFAHTPPVITQAPPIAEQPAPPPAVPAPAAGVPPQTEQVDPARRLDGLIAKVDQLRDPVARALVHECLSSLLAFYGEGLGRMLKIAQDSGPDGQRVLEGLADDATVRALLLIHGLHPVDLTTRLRQAMDKVRPYMESHGGNVELLSLENDFARFRLQGACKTCPSSSVTLELALRRAIEEACPDLAGFEVEGVQSNES